MTTYWYKSRTPRVAGAIPSSGGGYGKRPNAISTRERPRDQTSDRIVYSLLLDILSGYDKK